MAQTRPKFNENRIKEIETFIGTDLLPDLKRIKNYTDEEIEEAARRIKVAAEEKEKAARINQAHVDFLCRIITNKCPPDFVKQAAASNHISDEEIKEAYRQAEERKASVTNTTVGTMYQKTKTQGQTYPEPEPEQNSSCKLL